MKESVNFSRFCDAFADHDRTSQFTYEAKRALFDYLEEAEENGAGEIELDVVALCCEYTEYDDFKALQGDYPQVRDMDDLRDRTIVIPIDGTDRFIIQQF